MYRLVGIPWTPQIRRQGHLERLNVFAAWEHTKGSPTLPVGIIGLGVTLAHRELVAKTITGWDVTLDSANVFSDGGSTSGVSSALAILLAGQSRQGTYGVAPESPLVVTKFAAAGGDNINTANVGSVTNAAAAIRKAFDLGARIVCVPWMWAVDSQVLHDACDYVWNSGGLVIADAGDNANLGVNAQNTARYPAAYNNVVCVGGMQADDAAFSMSPASSWGSAINHGPWVGPRVDIAAPSSNVWTACRKTDGYYTIQYNTPDTSYIAGGTPSCALVAGVAQLIWSMNPALTNAQVRNILLACVDKSDGGWAFYNVYTKPGVGVPDAERAVLRAKALRAENAGAVFPYLRVHPARFANGDVISESRSYAVVTPTFNTDDTVRITSHGSALWEIGGECSAGPVTEVELWINGVREYIGPPSSKWSSPLYRTEHRNHLSELRIVARTAAGEVGERTYLTTGGDTALNTAAYELAGVTVSAQPGLAVVSPGGAVPAVRAAQSVAVSPQAGSAEAQGGTPAVAAGGAVTARPSAGQAQVRGGTPVVAVFAQPTGFVIEMWDGGKAIVEVAPWAQVVNMMPVAGAAPVRAGAAVFRIRTAHERVRMLYGSNVSVVRPAQSVTTERKLALEVTVRMR